MGIKTVIKMSKLLCVFFSILLLMSCKKEPEEKREVYYLYDIDKKFDRITELEQTTREGIVIHYSYRPKKYYMVDTLKVSYHMPLYALVFREGDSSFVKHKSFLEGIEYFGYDWFKSDSNTMSGFWKYKYRFNPNGPDSLRIYKIDPIPGTDSVLVRKVRRLIHPAR